MLDLSGQTIGVYQLTRLLGKGGMGAVYESHQISVKRQVAIKVLLFQLSESQEAVERFNREVEITAKLEHAHILPIYDFGVDAERNVSYIVMRLLTGGTLDERIRRHGRLSRPEILKMLEQIASALDFAHRRGIIHRDLKASNILFDDDNSAYLTDFGIARAMEGQTQLTKSGYIVGTPEYMAPEQWKGEAIDGRTDTYALGVLVYQLLTGKMPFDAPSTAALMYKHLNERAPAPTVFDASLPTHVNRVFEKVLAKEPSERYSSATEFYKALYQSLVNPAAVAETPPPRRDDNQTLIQTKPIPQAKRGGWLTYAAVAAVLIGLLGVGGLFLLMGGDDDKADNEVVAESTPESSPENSTNTPEPDATRTETSTETATEIAIVVATQTPIDTATFTATIPPTDTDTPVPTDTQLPSATNTNTPTPTDTATLTVAPTLTDSPSPTASFTLTLTPTATSTFTLTPSPTATSTPTFTPSNTPFPPGLPGGAPITANDQWTPIMQSFDGVRMVLVPMGTFTMGTSDAQYSYILNLCLQALSQGSCENLLGDERPQVQITFDRPFWIDVTEATTGGLPTTNLDPQMAQQTCESRGARLPTEAEWEYAARGVDGLTFTWGNEWESSPPPLANFCDSNCGSNWGDDSYDDAYPEAAPVGSYPESASWVGAINMGGNVWEWTSTIYRNYPYSATDGREDWSNHTTRRTLRGGAYVWVAAETTTTARATHIDAGPYTSYYGFRCVRDFELLDLRG